MLQLLWRSQPPMTAPPSGPPRSWSGNGSGGSVTSPNGHGVGPNGHQQLQHQQLQQAYGAPPSFAPPMGPPSSGNGFAPPMAMHDGPPTSGNGLAPAIAPPMSAPGQVRGAVHIGGVGAKCGMGCFGGLYLVARSWERCVAGTVRRRLRCGDQG